MRNLIFFIYKYYTFFLFLLLEIISLLIIFRYNNYQKASFLNFTGAASNGVYSAINNANSYFHLQSVNDSLMVENARLHGQLMNAFYSKSFTQNIVNDTNYKQQYTYISANIVNNSVTRRNNYITIDKGSDHGIERGMGVICNNGIVGAVQFVSKRFSVILSFLNSQAKVSVKLRKNNAFGSLVWEGGDPQIAALNDVNKHVPVKDGDEVITSNYSTIFPEGIPVGKVVSHELDEGENFYSISVNMYTDFGTLRNVYVIRNLLKEEQMQLEAQENQDKK